MYLLGYTKRKIATELNNRHLTTKVGAEFTTNSFACILSNRKYIGEYSWNRRAAKNQFNGKRNNSKLKAKSEIIVVPDAIPPIIDVDTFDKAQNLVNRSKTEARRGKSKRNYMLTSLDILYCKECGAPLIGICSRVHGKEYMRYRCPNHHKKKGRCALKDVNVDLIDDFIADRIISMLIPDNCLNRLNKQLSDECFNAALSKEARECKRRIDNLSMSLEQGFSQTLYDKLRLNETRLAEIEEQLRNTDTLAIRGTDELTTIRNHLKSVLISSDQPEIKQLIKSAVKDIHVGIDNVEVNLQN